MDLNPSKHRISRSANLFHLPPLPLVQEPGQGTSTKSCPKARSCRKNYVGCGKWQELGFAMDFLHGLGESMRVLGITYLGITYLGVSM